MIYLTTTVPESLAKAWRYLESGDVVAGLEQIAPTGKLQFIVDNVDRLKTLGVLEALIIPAYYDCAPQCDVKRVLQQCDRDKLRHVGSPMPGDGPYVLYRGIRTAPWPYDFVYCERIERGLSWTSSLDYACRYAAAQLDHGAYQQAVLRAVVPKEHVYWYYSMPGFAPEMCNEFCCEVREYEDLELSIPEIRERCERWDSWCREQGVCPEHRA